MKIINTLGKRKSAIARISIKDGMGNIVINQQDIKTYFNSSILQYIVNQPLNTLGVVDKYDITIKLQGGGYNGQAEAVRLGISRALASINPENKSILKKEGFITRDSREVERKKPGRPKARKKFQFSKR